ncbi:MAG: capsular biosynthesis protein, partial [[Eubacterium] rectale]|nr:capsular biosynthesis protein [Agathobacter rectalis]
METVTTSTNKEVEIDLLELFQVMLMHWKSLIASMVLLAAIFGLFTKFTFTPEYEAASELYVLSKSTSITSLADIQVGTSLTNDYEYVITGRTVLSTVIKNLGLKDTYEELKARVTIENPTDTRVIRIVV